MKSAAKIKSYWEQLIINQNMKCMSIFSILCLKYLTISRFLISHNKEICPYRCTKSFHLIFVFVPSCSNIDCIWIFLFKNEMHQYRNFYELFYKSEYHHHHHPVSNDILRRAQHGSTNEQFTIRTRKTFFLSSHTKDTHNKYVKKIL